MRRFSITKFLIIVCTLLAILLAIEMLTGCTRREEQAARDTGGAISRAVGFPPFVGEGIATLICSAITYITGEKRGRNKERRCKMSDGPKVPA